MAVLIDEDEAVHETVNRAGFRFFTELGAFRRYVQAEFASLEPA